MELKELFYSIHKRCYEQRANLAQAGPITLNTSLYTPDTLDLTLAEKEVNAVMSYLMSKDILTLSPTAIVATIKKVYMNQPFWKELLLDYLTWITTIKASKLESQLVTIKNDITYSLQKINLILLQKQVIVKRCIEKAAPYKFSVDMPKLIQNYLNSARINPEKAWNTLITNPAFFSPIITVNDHGKRILSPKEASNQNNQLANFFKNFRF